MDGQRHECPNCRVLQEQLDVLKAQVARLQAEVAKLRKDSGNSSKPPSSDIVKPKTTAKSAEQGKRKRGGQKGHTRHERTALDESQIDVFWDYTYDVCPDCGGPVQSISEIELAPIVVQQVELTPTPVTVSEHRSHACRCKACGKTHYAPIDSATKKAGLMGPQLTALVAYLKAAGHCSYSTIRKFLRDVLKIKVSRGYLAKVCQKVSQSLYKNQQLLQDLLAEQAVVNVDETGHKDNGDRMWTWCFRASTFTLFKISPTRSAKVLHEVLGDEFNGVLGCDYYSAYRKYMGDTNAVVQFCLAHLIRDVRFLVNHPDKENQKYGNKLLKAIRNLFAVIHRRDQKSPEEFALEIEDAANELLGAATISIPKSKEAYNIFNRFDKHGDSYIRFITTPGLEPTNNLAEQAIRFVVIDRQVTQGSRSEAGQKWLERIWTVMATCAQQGRSVFHFLAESVNAYLNNTEPPNLLPEPS